MDERDDIIRLTDPRALRAYAHPVRMKLISLLRVHGPLTATRAGELLGESSGTTSFHLRQLARYGLVEEAEGGTGRQKPWRATATLTDIPAMHDDPASAQAAAQVRMTVVGEYFESVAGWLRRQPFEEPRWQQAAMFGDRQLYLTADELRQLAETISAATDKYLGRLADPGARPDGARQVTVIALGFPAQ